MKDDDDEVDDEDVDHDHHITRQRTPNARDDARRARDDDDDHDHGDVGGEDYPRGTRQSVRASTSAE